MTAIQPIIGITSYNHKDIASFCSPASYLASVQRAGGIPILLPPVKTDSSAILSIIDGLILTGGGDIDPSFYGGSAHPTVYGVDRVRDEAEIALAQFALKTNKPILGICRGLEILAVATGGELIPHVPEVFGDRVIHRLDLLKPAEHPVEIFPETQLASIIQERQVNVVSWHHQAVRYAPDGWKITAKAPDGLIEAIESETHPWAIALQWHPEMAPDNPLQQRIFQAFIAAACQPVATSV